MCDPERSRSQARRDTGGPDAGTTVCASFQGGKRVVDEQRSSVLQIFRTWAVSNDACRYFRGVFDGGSQRTFVTEELCGHLRPRSTIGFTTIALCTFANGRTQPHTNRRVVEIRLRSQFTDSEVVLRAIVIPHICHGIEATCVESSFVATFKKSGKDIADELMQPTVVTTGGISVLIGSDQMWTVLSAEVSRFEENESLIGMNSKFRGTFQGTTTTLTTTRRKSRMMSYVLRTHAHAVESDEIVRSFWELESMGISESIDECSKQNPTIQRFEKTIRFLDGRYEVALHWKDGFELSNNKQASTTRLQRLSCRPSKNGGLLKNL
ncbi:hypothetical protein HPB48_006778 [Haemaphysalis longicornis]|uniref:Peptidase aspartic putative domain-containing protein n=1 Tax=Haemaphysalis longicornis TaxID=44386 RepID=A0A9J6FPA2_HAELO|nr:hypothetical protein HPB48_006778 [Haemaphysalis longicornis]